MKEIYVSNLKVLSRESDIDLEKYKNSNILILDTIGNANYIKEKYNTYDNCIIYKINKKKICPVIQKEQFILLLNIDNNTSFIQYRNIVFLLKNLMLHSKCLGIASTNCKTLGYITNNFSNKLLDEFFECLNALQYTNINEQYDFIYDTLCDKLDEKFQKENLCDFKNDQCIANRAGASAHDTMGCCYSFKYSKSIFKFIEDVKLCTYLDNKQCSTKCITCKLFICKYLRDKGIEIKLDEFLLVSSFFNKKQKEIISNNFFTKKDFILEKLIKNANKKVNCLK